MNGSGGPSNKGGGGLKKTFFQLFGPQFGLEIIEIRGGGGATGLPGLSPGSATGWFSDAICFAPCP